MSEAAARPASSTLHDIRTPLNQIIGYAELLTEQAEEEGQLGFITDLKRISGAGRQLVALLDGEATPPAILPKRGLAAPKTSPSPGEPALILLVDDNEANLDLLSRRMAQEGYGYATAMNGAEALQSLREREFDLVLLDIMMPVKDGFQVLQEMRAVDGLCQIPVVMISALDETESVARCIELGADDFLCKPFNPVLLKARVAASLSKKRAHDREKQLHAELQESYRRLQELEKLRDDLTHMVVHDLRTPLTSVISGMQSLEALGDLGPEQREMAGIAIDGGQQLLGMINQLLDVASLESGSMPLDYGPVDAEPLVASALSQVATLLAAKGLIVHRRVAAETPPFAGDEGMLRRVLVNLIGNAIKFTPEGGTVTVGARSTADGRSIELSVADSGEGIPREAFARIFEKFGQVESRQGGRTMSTGLGLTFCQLVATAHQGHIGVESTEGQGSIFTLTIPQTPPLPAEPAA